MLSLSTLLIPQQGATGQSCPLDLFRFSARPALAETSQFEATALPATLPIYNETFSFSSSSFFSSPPVNQLLTELLTLQVRFNSMVGGLAEVMDVVEMKGSRIGVAAGVGLLADAMVPWAGDGGAMVGAGADVGGAGGADGRVRRGSCGGGAGQRDLEELRRKEKRTVSAELRLVRPLSGAS